MKLTALPLSGCYVLEPELREDSRGFFARVFCTEELAGLGGDDVTNVRQTSVSFSFRRGTLRGLHYQAPPHEEIKIVRCTSGAAFDVAVDLRRESPTYRKWHAVQLSQENRFSVYLGKGVAHGVLTLVDNTELTYMMCGAPQVPAAARGIRWNDPALGIAWPMEPTVVSAQDAAWPLLG